MARPRTKLEGRQAAREVRERLGKERNAAIRERLIALDMGFTGEHTLEQIAKRMHRARSTIQLWFETYQTHGLVEALKPRRANSPGAPSQFTEAMNEGLREGLKQGRWRTIGQIVQWLEKEHGHIAKYDTVYKWVKKKMSGRLRVPRPAHVKRDPQKVADFKATLTQRCQKLDLPKDKPIRIWAQDECRYGLKGVQRACWGMRGHRIVQPVNPRYEYNYVYGAIEVMSGKSEFLITDGVCLEWTESFLQQLAKSDPEAEHIVIWDGAGFHHIEHHEKLPANVHVITLPSCSPELNPIEKLWDMLKDGICNQVFETLETMDAAVSENLAPFWQMPQKIKSLFENSYILASANN